MTNAYGRPVRHRLWVSSILAASVWVGSPAAHAGAASGPAAAEPNDGLEVITITARKQKENLQDAPVSVSAYSAERLEAQGVSQINRIQDFTPNLTFGNVPSNSGVASNAAIYIRGIGQNDFAPGVDPGVGIYIDGVYLGRSVGGVFDMVDVANVEVLRGPQGTLFGRNTIGGAVNITTQQPSDHWTGKADVKYGTDNRANLRALISGPITDTLSFKLGGGLFSQDGYVNAPYQSSGKLGNQDTKDFKGALRWSPSSRLDVTLAGEWSKDKSHGVPVVVTGMNTANMGSLATLANVIAAGNPVACQTAAYAANTSCYNRRLFSNTTFYGTDPTFSTIEMWNASATVSYKLSDSVDLKSITSLRHSGGAFAQDRDSSNLSINYVYDSYRQDQLTQEVQVVGKLGQTLNYIAGLYYFQEKGADINPVQFLILSEQSGGYFNYKSWAAFGQATWKPLKGLDVTAGLRYTEDYKKYTPDEYYTSGSVYFPATYGERIVPFATYDNNSTKATPMGNIAYHWNRELMTYFGVSQGFKGGGFTQRLQAAVASLPKFRPETLTSYELGFKYAMLNNRLRFNGAGFLMDYKDMQLLVADASSLGPYYTNAGKARIKGFELESNYAPGDGWRFNGSVGYTDAHYVQLDNSVSGLVLSSPFALVSRWTVNGSVEKVIDLGDTGTLTPRADWSYRSGFSTNANGVFYSYLYQPGYSLFNASVRWENGHYNASFGVDNIGNKHYRTFGDYQPSFGFYQESFDRGRQWNLKLGYSF